MRRVIESSHHVETTWATRPCIRTVCLAQSATLHVTHQERHSAIQHVTPRTSCGTGEISVDIDRALLENPDKVRRGKEFSDHPSLPHESVSRLALTLEAKEMPSRAAHRSGHDRGFEAYNLRLVLNYIERARLRQTSPIAHGNP